MEPPVCPKCGQQHDRCTAHNRRGDPCRRHPHEGAKVCVMHGAGAPQVAAAAQRNLDAERAKKAVATFGLPREVDPAAALLELVHATAGHVAWLSEQVRELGDDLVVDTMFGKQPSVWLNLYGVERDRLAKVSKMAIDAGIEERRVKLAEAAGEQLGTVIRNVLGDLFLALAAAGLAADVVRRIQREEAPKIVRQRLLEMAELNP